MKHLVTWVCLLLVLSGTGSALAQEEEIAVEARLEAARDRLESAAREVAELSSRLAGDAGIAFGQHVTPLGRRAMLGISLGDSADNGVPVAGVSPGGPADVVGLQAGDVLTSLNGEPLRGDSEQGAVRKLLTLMREVEPGETVTVAYTRDGQSHEALIVAEEFGGSRVFAFPSDSEAWSFDFRHPGPGLMGHRVFPDYLDQWGAMELVSLTPELGRYFGAEEGILVVRAPADRALQLQDGDVIRTIGGRTPKSPGHATRILASYQGGEQVEIDVLRDKKRLTLEIDIPATQDSAWQSAPTRHPERVRPTPDPST